MKFWDLGTSEIYWSIWIFLGFLLPEILAGLHILPMMTLSRTSWDEEARFPIMRVILFGFLIGLCIHIVFRTSLWKTELAALAATFLIHLGWKRFG